MYEVDPFICPSCGGDMKIISLIDAKQQPSVVEKILKHCELWKDNIPRPPPKKDKTQREDTEKSVYDYTFFDSVCA